MIPTTTSRRPERRWVTKVAAWAKANARDLGINYVIWNQHIWNITRDSEGWRYMADRGGDSANHKIHVHITFAAASLPLEAAQAFADHRNGADDEQQDGHDRGIVLDQPATR